MKATHATLLAALIAGMAMPALAQDPSAVVDAVPSAMQSILGQGITGAFAVAFLFGIIHKDRQITREREAATEKLLALSMAHAAGEAKITALMERIVRHLESKGSA